ncbi:MAG TPA: FAD-binding oxidoreductase, partial [Phototrophicaceae bacterium]|nr:FAD-binding oxidoreductase [Phototrophicaceae bacterium]
RFLLNPTVTEMPRTADVVIIGGGPAGTAAAWAIERHSPGTKTVLIEKSERLGAGSSLASLENFRTCWPALCLAQQMKRSVEIFQHADDYLGEGAAQSLAIKQRGYLFCAFNEHQAAGLAADVQRLHEIGLMHIEYMEAHEVACRFGWVGERVIAAKYDPTAGWLDSNALIHRYASSAHSAQFILGAREVNICVEHGRVTGVKTPFGDVASPNVVIAAGASSRTIGRTAGVELPIILRPRQSFTTGWRHNPFPEDAPMLIGFAPFPHVRPEASEGAIFGWEYTWNSKYAGQDHGTNHAHDAIIDPVEPVTRLKDARFPSMVLALLARQFGHQPGQGFADSRYLRGVSHNIGYYVYRDETSAYRTDADGTKHPYDSERAIIDACPEVEGLFISVAHVGHGIMSSPAAGEILAAKVLGMPLSDPLFEQFGLNTPWVEYDEGVL